MSFADTTKFFYASISGKTSDVVRAITGVILAMALLLISAPPSISQISKNIEEACDKRTAESSPGDFVYFWYKNDGRLAFDSVPLTSESEHPPAEKEYFDVNLNGEIGFCFVPNSISTSIGTFSAMVLKEALTATQRINDKVYLTIGDAVQDKAYSWSVWQNLGTESPSPELRELNSFLRGIEVGPGGSILNYRENLIFSDEFSSDTFKRTVDIVRWKITSNIKDIHWYHSPRERANKFVNKTLEIFVIQHLSGNELPRTFVLKMSSQAQE